MTTVIIRGLNDRASLISAIAAVMNAFNSESAYDNDEHVFVPSGDTDEDQWDGDRINDAARDGQRLRPIPYIPCPDRGTHGRLTECWMCWSDVMRGAALEPEVLSRRGWAGEHPTDQCHD